jgi:hypothetical protein
VQAVGGHGAIALGIAMGMRKVVDMLFKKNPEKVRIDLALTILENHGKVEMAYNRKRVSSIEYKQVSLIFSYCYEGSINGIILSAPGNTSTELTYYRGRAKRLARTMLAEISAKKCIKDLQSLVAFANTITGD